MGGCGSSVPQMEVSEEEKQRQDWIKARLREEDKNYGKVLKLLLLGPGESGKSTFVKQMKLLYSKGFSQEEKQTFKFNIHSNVFVSIRALINASESFQLQLSLEAKEQLPVLSDREVLMEQDLTEAIASSIKLIWLDPAIQEAFSRRNEFQLYDSAEYFFSHLDRIAKSDYVPTDEDVLRARATTTGITEFEFTVEETQFRVIDVGGQRSERRKWLHCFTSEVTAVIFLVAISEYDQKMREDNETNRLLETLTLFQEIGNLSCFSSTSLILFLNKTDLFREKIKKTELSVCFPDYQGGLSYDKATSFILDKFTSVINNNNNKEGKNNEKENNSREVYMHLTCATDTSNVKFVFSSVKLIILQSFCASTGF